MKLLRIDGYNAILSHSILLLDGNSRAGNQLREIRGKDKEKVLPLPTVLSTVS